MSYLKPGDTIVQIDFFVSRYVQFALWRFGDGAVYEFVPLAVEALGQIEWTARFLDLRDIAAADGCFYGYSSVRLYSDSQS